MASCRTTNTNAKSNPARPKLLAAKLVTAIVKVCQSRNCNRYSIASINTVGSNKLVETEEIEGLDVVSPAQTLALVAKKLQIKEKKSMAPFGYKFPPNDFCCEVSIDVKRNRIQKFCILHRTLDVTLSDFWFFGPFLVCFQLAALQGLLKCMELNFFVSRLLSTTTILFFIEQKIFDVQILSEIFCVHNDAGYYSLHENADNAKA